MYAFVGMAMFSGFSRAYANAAPHFHSEQEAKQHCPNDTVVWVNTKTGVYHSKGEGCYGATKEGAYECRKDDDAEGNQKWPVAKCKGRTRQTESGGTPQIGKVPDQRSVHKEYDISLSVLKHIRKLNQVAPLAQTLAVTSHVSESALLAD